jgi:periplasmic protein TonB
MEQKKSPKADLENKVFLFFEIGLVISLSIVLTVLNYETTVSDDLIFPEYKGDIPFPEEADLKIERMQAPADVPVEVQKANIIKIIDNKENGGKLDLSSETDIEETETYGNPEITSEQEVNDNEIYTVIEEIPSFPGGDMERINYVRSRLVYPNAAKINSVQGSVVVVFIIEKNGSISNIKIEKGIGSGCDEEAIRVVQNMPNWTPGKQRGKPVRVLLKMPIRFSLAS